MKKNVLGFVLFVGFCLALPTNLFATSTTESTQHEESDSSELDSLFNDSKDVEAVVTPTVEVEKPKENNGIIFTGNIATKLGGNIWFAPYDMEPGATFESTISFTCRPTDYFSMKGTVLAAFPEMALELYELYFDYVMWGRAYLSAGKKRISWGHARIFDSNILDDESDTVTDPEKLLQPRPKSDLKSLFNLSLTAPFPHGVVGGLVMFDPILLYETSDNKYHLEKFTEKDLAYAGFVEVSVGPVAFNIFAKKWATNDPWSFFPAVGAELSYTLGDLNIFLQYFSHLKRNADFTAVTVPRSKGTASIYSYWPETKIGLIVEYQVIYDESFTGDKVAHYFAAQFGMKRIFDTPISPALKWFHDLNKENYGTLIPGIGLSDILPSTTLKIGFPIYYGTKEKYGLALELSLNINY